MITAWYMQLRPMDIEDLERRRREQTKRREEGLKEVVGGHVEGGLGA
jgi:hypothetical protein